MIHSQTQIVNDEHTMRDCVDIKEFLFLCGMVIEIGLWDFGHKKTGAWPVDGG